MEDRVGLEPTMYNSRLKVCAARHYGDRSYYRTNDITQTIAIYIKMVGRDGIEPPTSSV